MNTIVVKSVSHTIGVSPIVITKQRGSTTVFTVEPLADLDPFPVGADTVEAYLVNPLGVEVPDIRKTLVDPVDGVYTYTLSDVETATLYGVYMLYMKIGTIIFKPVKVNFQ